jgi:hypothetical protein
MSSNPKHYDALRMHHMTQRQSKSLFGGLQSPEESGQLSFFKDKITIKITISKQMVACDKQKTALVCFWSVKYHTSKFRWYLSYCFWYTIVLQDESR